jgi:predicted CXXCH cytochrome family protein
MDRQRALFVCFFVVAITAAPRLLAQQSKPNGCATCHATLSSAPLSAPVSAVNGDVHYQAGVRCADCHGGNAAAGDAAAAHDVAHGFRGKPTGAVICASCHVLIAEKFKSGVHAEIFEKSCVECHSNHGIKRTSDALLGTGPGTMCAECHSEKDDPGFIAANKMRTGVDHLHEGIDAGTALITRVKNAGMDVGDQELALREAGTKLILARTEMHTLKPDSLDIVVTDGMKTVEGVNAGGQRALAELAYRRRGLFVSLAVILIFVVVLGLKIRELETRR